MCADLKIRVLSDLKVTKYFMLYQKNLNLNIRNYKIAVWEGMYIAPNASFYTRMPKTIQLQGGNHKGRGIYRTKTVDVLDFNTSYELYENNKGLDIKKSDIPLVEDETISVYNKCNLRKKAIVLRGNKPIFYGNIRSNDKLNFKVKDVIYVSICDCKMKSKFFKPTNLIPTKAIDFTGQSYLTIELKESVSKDRFSIKYNFDFFEYPDEFQCMDECERIDKPECTSEHIYMKKS